MRSLTEIVLTSAFVVAAILFIAGALAKKLGSKKATVSDLPAILADTEITPYATPFAEPLPPALAKGKVPTYFYNPMDLIGLGFIFLLFFAAAVSTARITETREVILTPAALVVSIGSQFLMAGVVVAIVIWRVRPIEWLGLHWKSWPWVFLIAPTAVVAMWGFFSILQVTGYMHWMESLGGETVQETVKILQTSKDPLLLGLMSLAAVIVAPLCEEIVFRGYLYPAAKKFTGRWIAALCSALVFSALHGNMTALFPLFIFGLVLVFVYEKTGSLWAPIAVHLCFNGATVLVQMAVRFLEIPLGPQP
jgi:membrane protease YdiL (CAAX protease family)